MCVLADYPWEISIRSTVHRLSYLNTCMAIMAVWCVLGTGCFDVAWERVSFEEGLIIFILSDLYLSLPFFT